MLESFLTRLQAWGLQLNQKETPTQVFSCKIYEIFKSTYFEEYVRVAASRGTLVYFTQNNQWNKNIWIYVWIFLKVGRGRVGGVVYSGGQEMKIFGTGFQHFEKNLVGKGYFQH